MARRVSTPTFPPAPVQRPAEVEGLPPVAMFYSLLPLGVDTTDVESLDGYSVRLAREHRVPVRTLHEMFVVRAQHGESMKFVKLRSIDAPTEAGKSIARSLATSTGIAEVANLGLHPFSGALGRYRTLRPVGAWCGECFKESREAGVPAYWRLLWSLEISEVCPHHALFLQTQCPACGREFHVDTYWNGPLDACPYCRSDLATSARPDGTFEKGKGARAGDGNGVRQLGGKFGG
jgi:hypothetical protein